MKKKVNISVTNLIHKKQKQVPYYQADKQNIGSVNTSCYLDSRDIQSKHIRFEQMYRMIKKGHTPKSDKIVYDSKRTTPSQSHRNLSMFQCNTNKNSKHKKCKSGISTPKQTPIQIQPKLSCNILQQINQNNSQDKTIFFPNQNQFVTPSNKSINNSLQKQSFPINNQYEHQQYKTQLQSTKQPLYEPISPKLQPTQILHKQNSDQSININIVESKKNGIWPLSSIYYQIIQKQLNHQMHSHVHDEQCFLNQQQIVLIMQLLGYVIDAQNQQIFQDMLIILQYDIYGGIPSNNLHDFLKIIDGNFIQNCYPKSIPSDKLSENDDIHHKIVNNNLKLIASLQKQLKIYNDFKLLRQSKHKIYGKSTSNNKNTSLRFQQMFAQQNNLINQKLHQASEHIQIEDQSSDQQPPSDQWRQKTNDSQIIQLKNRLNKALSKVSEQKSKFLSNQKSNKIDQTFQNDEQLLESCQAQSKKPILSVDVNLGEGVSEKIIVCESQTAREVSDRLMIKYSITEQTRLKFEKMLQAHLNTMLWKIDQVSEELLTDRQ